MSLNNEKIVQKKSALVTGIGGQDGQLLTELLLANSEDYKRVIGTTRTCDPVRLYSHDFPTSRLQIVEFESSANVFPKLLEEETPDEIYHLAGPSFVPDSWKRPFETTQGIAGPLDAFIDHMRKHKGTRLFFAASSEIFGRNQPADYEETSSIAPVTPYGLSKAHCLQMLKLLREQEGLQVTTGILFNHESHLRPESFVTMKICKGFKNFVSNGLCMSLGSLDSERDWGMATDFVKAYSELLSGGHTGEFVIATGRRLRVRDFVESVARHFGVELEWHGHGADEFATCKKTGKRVLQVDPQFFRKDEPLAPCGNVTKLKNALGWSPSQSVDELVKLMCKEMK